MIHKMAGGLFTIACPLVLCRRSSSSGKSSFWSHHDNDEDSDATLTTTFVIHSRRENAKNKCVFLEGMYKNSCSSRGDAQLFIFFGVVE